MTGKIKLYIGLLVLGVVLIGGGVWFLVNAPPAIDIPESDPVIAMNTLYTMRGERSQLAIYEDGTIICVEDKGLRFPLPGNPATRTWKTGQLQGGELNSLLEFFKDSRFAELDDSYGWSSIPQSDLDCEISVNYQGLVKNVRATGYLSTDGGMTYPDMPYPLNEIYRELKHIAENRTEEVRHEPLS